MLVLVFIVISIGPGTYARFRLRYYQILMLRKSKYPSKDGGTFKGWVARYIAKVYRTVDFEIVIMWAARKKEARKVLAIKALFNS